MSKRTIGTIIMAVGFVIALAALVLHSENRQIMVLGFVLIGIGSVVGVRPRGGQGSAQQKDGRKK